MSFLKDASIKSCREEEMNETLDTKGCGKFIANCIVNCEKVLTLLKEVYLTI
jgi:hypothetical protein